MGRKLDPSQQAAVDTGANTVVTAGAGSGKTTVLARRFVALIAGGLAQVDGILTLTFTRKAAAEMYERIYRLLLEQSRISTDPAEKSRLLDAVANFDEARISTLDSFCGSVVRGASAGFGVPGDFRQDEYAAAKMNTETALQFMLENSGRDPLKRVIREFGMEPVLEQFLIPLANDEFHMAREYDFPLMFAKQCEYLRGQALKCVEKLEDTRCWFLNGDLPEDKKSLQKVRSVMESCESPAQQLSADDWIGLQNTAGLPVKNFGGAVKDPILVEGKEKIVQWQEAVKELEPILMLFIDGDLYREIYSLLGDFQLRIMNAKRSSGVLTFRDVVEMAVLLLCEDQDLRSFYKSRFSHIMIDEFQDNNDLQRRLLFLLAERDDLRTPGVPGAEQLCPGKLFFVGDEKQSIYRFRGADVRVLKQLQTQMYESGGTSLPLDYNYRSHSELIAFFNRLFARIMPADGELSDDFEARFTPLTAPMKHTAFHPVVQLFYKPYEEDEESAEGEALLSSSEAEAWTIARFIKQQVESGSMLVRDGFDSEGREIVRPAGYDDIAILMRSSGNQINFEKYLRRLKVPFMVQSIRSLFQEAPINDIYQFLQLLVYPDDMITYAALLRSPFVRLSDDVVFRLLLDAGENGIGAFEHTGEEEFFTAPSGSTFSAARGGDREKYLQARQVYHELLAMAGNTSIHRLIRHLWYEAGYRYVVLRNPDYHLYLEFYDALTALARRSDSRGENLPVFLDFIRENLGDYKKLEDLELIPRSSGGVQIMSIHKSKGLEFPVVIVSDMGNSGGGDRGKLFVWDDTYGLVLNLPETGKPGRRKRRNYFTERAQQLMKQQETAELKRLLYVACTRARDHLVLSGYHHSKNRNVQNPEEQNVLLNMVLQAFGWDGEISPFDLPGAGGSDDTVGSNVPGPTSGAGGSDDTGGRNDADSTDTPVDRSILGCRISRICDHSVESVFRQSSFSRGLDPREVQQAMRRAATVNRSFTRREWTPTELNGIYRKTHPEGEAAAERIQAAAGIFDQLDALLAEHGVAGSFGELAHSCIENRISRKPGRVPLPAPLVTLTDHEHDILEQAARRMAENFLSSELGREILAASAEGRTETELPFLLSLDSPSADEQQGGHGAEWCGTIRGQIDLLLLRPDRVVVIDFKTDHTVVPDEYAAQMEVYRRAASRLYDRPAESRLVYLRSGRIVDMDTPVDLAGLIVEYAERSGSRI